MKRLFIITLLLSTVITVSFSQRRGRSRIPESQGQNVNPITLPETNWTIDKDHSEILFSVNHLGINEVSGIFLNFQGNLSHRMEDYSDAQISFTVDAGSINTNNSMRDNHLKSAEFFNAAKFPEVKFESTSFKPLGGKKYRLTGKLTIKDITRTVSFDVLYGGMVDALGTRKIGFSASATINRFDYDINWDQMMGENISVIDKYVDLVLNLEFTRS